MCANLYVFYANVLLMNRPFYPPPRQTQIFYPVIATLLLANGLLFAAQTFFNPLLISWLALWPLATPDFMVGNYGAWINIPSFYPWQIFTYGFLHGSLMHIFFNMFALWMFGSQIERVWGPRRFFTYYAICVIGAGLVQLLVATMTFLQTGIPYPTLGASGGVFGILLAFAMLFPEQRIFLIFLPIPIKAKYFVVGYGALELWAGITGTQAGVAHFAHLGGMLVGLIVILYWRRRTNLL